MIERETERLLLRGWDEEKHFEPYAACYADETTARYIGGVLSRDQAWRRMASLIGHWTLRGHGFWALEEKASGRFAGCVGLWRSAGWPELELGYLVVPEMQGRGYAVEAGIAARDFAWQILDAPSLVSFIHPDNEPSKRVAERLGARFDEVIELLTFGPHCVYRHPRPESTG